MLFWNDRSATQLDSVRADAQRLAGLGHHLDAEKGYRYVLSGYQHTLPPMHPDTVELAYEVASMFAASDQLENARAILCWLIDEHLRVWNLGERTLDHVDRSVDMLCSWNSIDEAISMVEKIERDHFRDRSAAANLANLSALEIEAELVLCRAYAKVQDDLVERRLLSLAAACSRQADQFAIQLMRVWSFIVELTAADEAGNDTTSQASSAFHEALEKSNSKPMEFFDGAVDMMIAIQDAGNNERTHGLARSIESTAVETFGADDVKTVRVLINIGLCFQDNGNWNGARPFIEHALVVAGHLLGLHDELALDLERAIESGHLELSDAGRDTLYRSERMRRREQANR
jgi:hypothetical protein